MIVTKNDKRIVAKEMRKMCERNAKEMRKPIIIGITRREEEVMRIIPHHSLLFLLMRVKSFVNFRKSITTATAWR